MRKTKRDLTPWHKAWEKMVANYTGQWSEITIQDFYDNWVKPEIAVHKIEFDRVASERKKHTIAP